MTPRALFVLGAPRSGTTLIGNYLASSPDVLNLGEYGGFHVAHNVAPSVIGRIPGPFRDDYLGDLAAHARRFAENLAAAHGRAWYCDSTPWNINAAHALVAQIPDAVFVCTLRHYAGSLQSLRRARAAGFMWAGNTWEDSAKLWASSYAHLVDLPPDRVLPFGYDALARKPEETLGELRAGMGERGLDTSALDDSVLAVSHATPVTDRPTVGVIEDGRTRLRAFPSFDPARWSGDIQRSVWPIVRDVHHALCARFPRRYVPPEAPDDLHAHHDIHGLVPFKLEEW